MDKVKEGPVFQLLVTLLLGLDQKSARVTISPIPSVQIQRLQRSRAITLSSVLFLDRDIIGFFFHFCHLVTSVKRILHIKLVSLPNSLFLLSFANPAPVQILIRLAITHFLFVIEHLYDINAQGLDLEPGFFCM